MDYYQEGIDAMWAEVEGKKTEPAYQPEEEPTVEERWQEFLEEHSHSGYVVLSEFGAIDTSDNAMKDVVNGEKLPYDEYLYVLFNSRNDRRSCFEFCYYSNASCRFKGQINRFNKKNGTVLFNRIFISAGLMDGDLYKGKEDHVWIDSNLFDNYQVGDCVSFEGDIYRYLKTRNGKQISFGIGNPYSISKIEPYELPTENDMIMQTVDQLVCESCLYNEQCYMGFCIANKEWLENMRKSLFDAIKGIK